jgi:hypothetical protein
MPFDNVDHMQNIVSKPSEEKNRATPPTFLF